MTAPSDDYADDRTHPGDDHTHPGDIDSFPDDGFTSLEDGPGHPGDNGPRTEELWPGDAGQMSHGSRRAFLQLVRGPFLSSASHPALWRALENDERAIRSHLADLFLDLVVDRDAGIAFARNVSVPDVDTPKAARSFPLTLIDTIMLLSLRLELVSHGGERIIVGKTETFERLRVYRPATQLDIVGFDKRLATSWTKLINNGVLMQVDSDERCEISPILKLIFGADEVKAIGREYGRLLIEATDGHER